jgi:hypothetical protein
MRFAASSHKAIAASDETFETQFIFSVNAKTKVTVGFECMHGDLELLNHDRD